jgi:NADPH2:quinone reductase
MDRSLTLTGGDLWNVLTGPEERLKRADALFAMVRQGTLKPRIAARVSMRDGSEAHRLLEGRGTIGKVLLVAE